MRLFQLPVVFATVTALITVTALTGQQTPPPAPAAQAQPQVVLKSSTRLVQVSVIAQDGKGQPVTDLTKDDFRIKVNGKDQPIKVFSMDTAGGLPTGTAEEKLPPNVYTNRLIAHTGQQSGITIIMLDLLNTQWKDQVYAKAQVIRYLRTLKPEDHIGLYVLSSGLRVLHDYTADSSELLSRLDALKGKDLPDMTSKEPTDAMHGDSLVFDAWQRTMGGGVSQAERAFWLQDRANATLKAIQFIANHLAKTPGRKNLVWVSSAFPLTIGYDGAAAWRPQTIQLNFADEISETVRAVNDANMAIYPVDARGLIVGNQFDASNAGPRNPRAATKAPPMVGVKNQDTMNELASRTGGRAYYNSNDLAKAIHNAVDDSRVTYMLGFYPVDETFDGKFHKIEVQTIERKGVHLRYRKGFFDLPELPQDEKSRKAELADASFSPLDASGIGIAARILPAKDKPGTLEIVVAIDSTQVNLQEQDQHWVGRLDVLFVQRDNQGNQFNGLDDSINLRLSAENYTKFVKNGFVYSKLVSRSDRAKTIRIIVRDSASGAIGSITVSLAKVPA